MSEGGETFRRGTFTAVRINESAYVPWWRRLLRRWHRWAFGSELPATLAEDYLSLTAERDRLRRVDELIHPERYT